MHDQIERNRFYVRSVVEVIQFLVVNELPLRGSSETGQTSTGLFQHLYEYSVAKDNKLQNVLSSIPGNAKYTSPDIQNEIISALADFCVNAIITEAKTSQCYAVLADETRDRQGVEDLAIGIRFVPADATQAVERCIAILALPDQSAATITDAIISTLDKVELDNRRLIAQGYDGASVMSGHVRIKGWSSSSSV